MADTDSSAESYFKMAGTFAVSKRYGDAELYLRKALEINPGYGAAWGLLGGILSESRRFPEAEAAYRHAIEIQPDSPEVALGLANTLRTQGKAGQSLPYYRLVRRHLESQATGQSVHGSAHALLGFICLLEGDWPQAETSLRMALQAQPDDIDNRLRLAEALLHQCKAREALKICEKILHSTPGNIKAIQKVAEALDMLGKPAEALQRANQMLAIQPDHGDAIIFGAHMLEKMGRPEEGYDRLLPLIEHDRINNSNIAMTFASLALHIGVTDEAIRMLERMLDTETTLKDIERCMLQFALGDLLDRQGSYDMAFAHYRLANQLRHAAFSPKENTELINSIISVFTRENIGRLPRSDINSGLPVFIIGMPRSGTTLVEQILSSHPEVYGAGELHDIMRIAESLAHLTDGEEGYPACIPGLTKGIVTSAAKKYLGTLESLAGNMLQVTDKMPYNFLYLGLIQLLFPGARIIHCKRNPVDTCLSCYFKNFLGPHPYAYNLEHLGSYYRDYMRLMEHWRTVLDVPIYDISYESLVSKQETVSRELVRFCGLEWNDACLRFYENERFAATSSYNQVRQPVYTTSVERWRNYERHLGPLIRLLDKS